MARAKRHYIPGQVWHITHRCHKREFLLKFSKDRQRWLHWLLEAKKRYGLPILNYTVTSNHIHLLVADDKGQNVIPSSIQLIAGRTGQEFNQRKGRKGAGPTPTTYDPVVSREGITAYSNGIESQRKAVGATPGLGACFPFHHIAFHYVHSTGCFVNSIVLKQHFPARCLWGQRLPKKIFWRFLAPDFLFFR